MEAKDEDRVQQVVSEAKELIRVLESSSVRRVSLQAGDFKIEIERAFKGGLATVVASAPAGVAAAGLQAGPAKDTLHRVLAPLVGTFYRAASPGAKPFVEVGTRVQRGQAIGVIEAMKIMNEVASDAAGTVEEILVENGQPVQYEQALLVIDTAP